MWPGSAARYRPSVRQTRDVRQRVTRRIVARPTITPLAVARRFAIASAGGTCPGLRPLSHSILACGISRSPCFDGAPGDLLEAGGRGEVFATYQGGVVKTSHLAVPWQN